jgi:hypothetical protein
MILSRSSTHYNLMIKELPNMNDGVGGHLESPTQRAEKPPANGIFTRALSECILLGTESPIITLVES